MKNRVFFTGAGFSKALCPSFPTLNELSASVVNCFVARNRSGAIRQHFDQLPMGMAQNVEQLLSYLHSDWPWKSSVDKDLDSALFKALIYEISVVLTAIKIQPL